MRAAVPPGPLTPLQNSQEAAADHLLLHLFFALGNSLNVTHVWTTACGCGYSTAVVHSVKVKMLVDVWLPVLVARYVVIKSAMGCVRWLWISGLSQGSCQTPNKLKTRQKESKSELWPDFEHRCEEVKPGCSVFLFLLCEKRRQEGCSVKV